MWSELWFLSHQQLVIHSLPPIQSDPPALFPAPNLRPRQCQKRWETTRSSRLWHRRSTGYFCFRALCTARSIWANSTWRTIAFSSTPCKRSFLFVVTYFSFQLLEIMRLADDRFSSDAGVPYPTCFTPRLFFSPVFAECTWWSRMASCPFTWPTSSTFGGGISWYLPTIGLARPAPPYFSIANGSLSWWTWLLPALPRWPSP